MVRKSEVRATYYAGAKAALEEHMAQTEEGVRALPGLEVAKAEKLIAAVRKRHSKLIAQLDDKLASETAAAA